MMPLYNVFDYAGRMMENAVIRMKAQKNEPAKRFKSVSIHL